MYNGYYKMYIPTCLNTFSFEYHVMTTDFPYLNSLRMDISLRRFCKHLKYEF
jgi:hypothetical protein